MRTQRVFLGAALVVALGSGSANVYGQALPRITANDNMHAGGRLQSGAVVLKLTVVRALFHPDGPDNPGEAVLAFAEEGKGPTVPGPLLRIRAGTTVDVAIRNADTDSTLVVYGLTNDPLTDSLVIKPGETGSVRYTPGKIGTSYYYGTTTHNRVNRRFGQDSQLGGAIVVDPATGRVEKDRIFIISMYIDSANAAGAPIVSREVLMINGLSWPHTERLRYEVGEVAHWRFINASFDVHPMHLHGFYFMVTGRGDQARDTMYARDQERRVVTERMLPGTTMSMRWAPEKPGNWVMHCHLTFHILPHRPLAGTKESPKHKDHKDGHAIHGMSGLVMGIEVPLRTPLAKASAARRNLRLLVNESDSAANETQRRFGFVLHEPGNPEPPRDSVPIPGSPIIVQQNDPIAITVVNRTAQPTSIHWHGIELESFYDGVAGFGGYPKQISPSIEPNDSFTVYMTPPRAGTFMYHTHVNERKQQPGGLYAAFIVLPPEQKLNVEDERVVILSTSRSERAPVNVLLNGSETPEAFELKAGQAYRFRFINITMAGPNLSVQLKRGDQLVEWKAMAEDGADLEPQHATVRGAQQQISIGKTYDFEVRFDKPEDLQLNVVRPNGQVVRSLIVKVK